MNNSWLEQTRFPLESIETLQRAIVKQMFIKLDNPKDTVIVDGKINIFIKMIQEKAREAVNLIKDQDLIKKEQLSILAGQKSLSTDKSKPPSIWQNFYDKMKELKQFHKKYTGTMEPPKNTVEYFNKIVYTPPYKQPEFSLEEAKGKFVDMHSLYLQYLNFYKGLDIKQDQKFGDYLWFLQNFDKLDEIPVPVKLKNIGKYTTYIKSLIQYLHNYLVKVRPLNNVDNLVKLFEIDFEDRYESGAVRGWEKSEETQQDKSVYCTTCKKIFINQDAYVSHLNGKKHLKASKQQDKQNQKSQQDPVVEQNLAKQKHKQQQEAKKKEIALLEYRLSRYRDELANIIYDTMNLIRKKQTRGYEEQQQIEEQEQQEEVDPDQPIYNPKNLPLGWDGKPIPYWLYKLHGLGIEYKCEICGNYSYWGRRSFEMHFQEWRHTYGMKCLKIPNTIHFKDVTTINDALALHQKLMSEAQASQFRPDLQQEFEDTDGNIINRRTYHDMKKQGIL